MYVIKDIVKSSGKNIVELEEGENGEIMRDFKSDKRILRFSLGKEFWDPLGYDIGDELYDEDIVIISDAVKDSEAASKALDVLSYSNHSRKSLIMKLRTKYLLDGERAAKAADYCVRKGYIDEEYQAAKYAESSARTKLWGESRIVRELYAKGYPPQIAKKSAASVSEDIYMEALKKAVRRKVKSYPADRSEKLKIVSSISRLGHKPCDIEKMIKEYLEEFE